MDFLLKYEGELADEHELDFYDAARAMMGFQRSLALTTHLIVNGEIITQAPSLKNARITVATPRPGSWEIVATVVGGLWAMGTAGKDTPFGHLLYSAYDYVVSQTLGFPVDFGQSLYQQYRNELQKKDITPAKLDSLSEKIENSLADIHRPIVASETANHAEIYAGRSASPKIMLGHEFNEYSYDYIKQFHRDDHPTHLDGVISSYTRNTYSGRVFSFEDERPISFRLLDGGKSRKNINLLTSSLRSGAVERGTRDGAIRLKGLKIKSTLGKLKAIDILSVERIED